MTKICPCPNNPLTFLRNSSTGRPIYHCSNCQHPYFENTHLDNLKIYKGKWTKKFPLD